MEKKVKDDTKEDFEEKYKAEKKERMEYEARLMARIDALEERLRVFEERTRVFEERTRVFEERTRVVEERTRVVEIERDIIGKMFMKRHYSVVKPLIQGKNFYDDWKRKWKKFLLYINEL